ncbi:glucose-1-phosphate thymidylyltransferase [Streptomyces sp. MST-110588]|uniref:glucose-1-phosphate thymidylyltransferase n=1 Tax=Streptomyces sp. MST-110588 TaxID=2833628 RepID=UPI001F5D34F6|nr:glucose-1-phosphate thymidylyltransferase [Streptomyces sp. MST-110588]UNO40788.1 glucose-1-phosphate thymidylyltransferase [Streptomyces sp. MST-110588]
MKALVLAGGSGTRLRPLSHTMAKQLIPVAGRPVLMHCLADLAEIGVTEVGMIIGARGEETKKAVGDGADFGLKVTYIPQPAPLGLAHCVKLARGFLGEDDFVMYLGDNILADGIADAAAEFARNRPDAQIVLTRVANPREFGVAELDADGRIVALAEKPDRPRSDLAMTGVYFFTPAVHEAVEAIRPSARGELEITDALSWMLDHGRDVRATEFLGYWKDTGRVDDVLEVNRVLMERLKGSVRGEVDAASTLRGEVVVEPGARITASTVVGPAVIGAGTQVSGSHIGPYTTLGRDCTLLGAGIEYSIVLDGVSVRHVEGLHGSMIGREADITAATARTRRLVIGDHAKVEVL